ISRAIPAGSIRTLPLLYATSRAPGSWTFLNSPTARLAKPRSAGPEWPGLCLLAASQDLQIGLQGARSLDRLQDRHNVPCCRANGLQAANKFIHSGTLIQMNCLRRPFLGFYRCLRHNHSLALPQRLRLGNLQSRDHLDGKVSVKD